MMWASEAERMTKFHRETFTSDELADLRTYGFASRTQFSHGRDEDGCELVVLELHYADGAVETHRFYHRDAFADAASFVAAAQECATTTLEERLGAYGLEWEREQAERAGVA